MDTAAERLIVLQDLLELRNELNDAEGVSLMMEMGFEMGERRTMVAEVEATIAAVRTDIRPGLLKRFDRVSAKYRRPLAPLRNGTCYGCFTRVPTAKGDLAASDGVTSCPNCGRLFYEI